MINVTTRIGELKTHSLILTRLRQAVAARDFSLFVIFPTLHVLQTILSEILFPGNPGFGGARLLLFQGFQEEVCQLLGVRRRVPTPLAQELLITQLFRQLIRENNLSYLGEVPFTRHYRQAILEGIAEWNRSGMTPDVFAAWMNERNVRQGKKEECNEIDLSNQGARLEELSLLYRRYQELLSERGFTHDYLILDQLKAIPPPGQKQGSVIVYGFTDLTSIQFQYLETLNPWFDVEFIIDPTPVPEFQARTARWISSFSSAECNLSITGETVNPSQPANSLKHLQDYLWVEPIKSRPASESTRSASLGPESGINFSATDRSPTEPADDSVQLIQTAGALRAITAIAREIVELMTNHPGYQWDDFLIIHPEPFSFRRTAGPVFREYGLPLSEIPVSLREVPCISHWLQAITVVNGNWPWPEMEILIRQSYRGSQASLGDRVILEITQEYGALSGRERWLRITASDGFQRYFTEIGLNIQPLLQKVAWLARIPETSQLHDYLAHTLDWLRDFGSPHTECGPGLISDTEENRRARVMELRGADFFRAMALELSQFIADLSEFQGDLSVGEFGQFLLDYLLNQEIAGPGAQARAEETGIRVLPPREIRGLTAPIVFMTGLEQGVFPGIYINDWKITSLERRELSRRGITLETAEQYQLQEKMAFYWGLQAAGERLYLVVRDQDDNAQPFNPSIFFEEICKWLPELSLGDSSSSLAPSLPESFSGCRSRLECRQYWAYCLTSVAREAEAFGVSSETLSEEEPEIHQRFLEDAEYRALAFHVEQWRKRLAVPSAPFFTQPESWKALERIYHSEYAFAITALEEFRRCPYRFYFRHLLKVRPLYKPQLFPSGFDLGDLYHEILQEFGANYLEQSLIPERQLEYQKYLDECFESFFREWLDNAPNDPVRLILLLKAKEIRRNLASWLAAELQQNAMLSSRFQIKYLELAFGLPKGDSDPNSTLQPFSCEFEDQKASFWGKVDRVDQDSAGNFIVYDYKSGKIPSIQSILKLEENLQLPVYIMALEQLFFGADRAAGGSYLGLRRSIRNRSGIWRKSGLDAQESGSSLKIKPLTEEEWQSWLTDVRRALVETARAIRQGEFGGRAEKCVNFCEYRNLCLRQAREEESSLEK